MFEYDVLEVVGGYAKVVDSNLQIMNHCTRETLYVQIFCATDRARNELRKMLKQKGFVSTGETDVYKRQEDRSVFK